MIGAAQVAFKFSSIVLEAVGKTDPLVIELWSFPRSDFISLRPVSATRDLRVMET